MAIWRADLNFDAEIRSKRTKHISIHVSAEEVPIQRFHLRAVKHDASEAMKVFECIHKRTCTVVPHIVDDSIT